MAKVNNELLEEFPDVLPDPNALSRKWTWKDETNSLELVSNPGAGGSEKNNVMIQKNKRMKGGAHGGQFADIHRMKVRDGTKKVQSTFGTRHTVSPKSSSKLGTSEARTITLEDVKGVAMDLLSDIMDVSTSFELCYNSSQFDEFLLMLFYYFNAYLERLALENKPKPMATEPSAQERAQMSFQLTKQETAQKQMAEKYCTLLLGLGRSEQHHMSCGKQRKSHTKMDRTLYETMYRFCVYAVWITFKRQEYKLIEKEVGRLFRSTTFNPSSREERKEEFRLASELAKEEDPDFSLSSGGSSTREKRPAITSIVNQRSPVIISLLPTSQESGSWLLDRRNAMLKQIEVTESASSKDLDVHYHLLPVESPRVGIIGDAISGYNLITLAPFGDDHEEKGTPKRPLSTEAQLLYNDAQGESTKEES